MNTVAKKHQLKTESPPPPEPKPKGSLLLFLLISITLGMFAAWKSADFLEVDKDGNVGLSSERQNKLEKRLKQLEHAEQYVLLADVDGWFPCYNCGHETQIFLRKGEVWKYGVTIQGEKGRYRNSLKGIAVLYQPQFVGSLQDCLKQEAIKIYNYAKLPENLKRDHPLIRPPGNRVDL